MLRWFAALVILLAVIGGTLFLVVSRSAPPTVTIEQPTAAVGQNARLAIVAGAPGAKFTTLTAKLEQNGKTFPLYSLDASQSATVAPVDADHIRVSREFG